MLYPDQQRSIEEMSIYGKRRSEMHFLGAMAALNDHQMNSGLSKRAAGAMASWPMRTALF